MTRQEFTEQLSAKLFEVFSTAEALRKLNDYNSYINGGLREGRSEEEIIEELGTPEDAAAADLTQKSADGLPESEAAVSEEIMLEKTVLDENSGTQGADEDGNETTDKADSDENPECEPDGEQEMSGENPAQSGDTEPEADVASDADSCAEPEEEIEHVSGEVEGAPERFMHTRDGKFDWNLLAALIAAAMVLIGGIWLVTKIVLLLGPILICAFAILLIVYTISSDRPES